MHRRDQNKPGPEGRDKNPKLQLRFISVCLCLEKGRSVEACEEGRTEETQTLRHPPSPKFFSTSPERRELKSRGLAQAVGCYRSPGRRGAKKQGAEQEIPCNSSAFSLLTAPSTKPQALQQVPKFGCPLSDDGGGRRAAGTAHPS